MISTVKQFLKQPKSVWVAVLGTTLLVPLLFVLILGFFTTEIRGGFGVSGWPLMIVAALFFGVFYAATSYYHSLVIHATRLVSQETFSFIKAFSQARSTFTRALILNSLFGLLPLALFVTSFFVSGILSYALAIGAGIITVIFAYIFLPSATMLRAQSVADALKTSMRTSFTKDRLISWAVIKFAALCVTVLFFGFGYEVLAGETFVMQAVFVLTHFFLVLGSILAPQILFITVLFFGAVNAVHFAAMLFVHVLFVVLVTAYLSKN